MAHPRNPGAELVVSDQSKKRETDSTITYLVTVRNVGTFNTNFSLQGGGFD